MKEINNWSEAKGLSPKVKQVKWDNVIYTRHKNPNGSVGGFVAKTARVATSAWVSGDAWVYGNAWVSGNARVYGDKITSLVKTIRVFARCISITPNYVFCGCEKWQHKEVKALQYEKCRAKDYMTKKQFEILKKMVLLAIKY